ncbi:coiled-coil domain-containing protein 17 isoform X1 [Pygocentrus nattereri]|uniref:coiled-coil domain-containing protein 17 isoform X1 n=1 Tax=Pygocentrus nattereri TaxID=42514 RepID=UPI0008145FB5|nr:coiled-coil domain-containing protein 17 isoform X1 [Pygocentrus nattereri]
MERMEEFICRNCNMTFRSFGLLDKHKTRFCIGSEIGDPVKLKTSCVEMRQPERAALRGVAPKRTQTPDLTSLREQRNQLLRQKDRQKIDLQDSTAESQVINQLTVEFHKLRMSIEESLSRRHTERVNDERLREVFEHHGQKLAEIRAHNAQLVQQRKEIERRLAELSGHGKSSVHLEDLLQELKEQEEKNEDILHQLSTQINGLQGMKEADISSDVPEDKKTQHVTFDLISVDGPLSSQIRSLRLVYLQSGGSDPEVLAHMHDLQAEAYTLEQARVRDEHKATKRRAKTSYHAVDSDLVAVEHDNQRLEEEILRLQLVRDRHRREEALSLVQKHQIHQLARLQAEISSLKKELERGRKGTRALDSTLMHSLLGKHVPDPMDSLGPAPYDPVAGFVIFYDMVLNVDASFRTVYLVARLYSGGQEMGWPTPMPPVQCQPAGSLASTLSRNPGNYSLLAVKQSVPRMHPSPALSLMLELQAAGGLDSSGQEVHGFVPIGWTRLQLFDQHNQVQSGFWRVPVHCLPLRPSLSLGQLNSVPQLGNMEICLRVVNARDGGVQSLTKIDPNNTSHYKFPPMVISHLSAVLEAQAPQLPTLSSLSLLSSHPHTDQR